MVNATFWVFDFYSGLGYTLEQPQAAGIVGIVWIVGIVGISLLTKVPTIRSFMGLIVIIEAHDALCIFCAISGKPPPLHIKVFFSSAFLGPDFLKK